MEHNNVINFSVVNKQQEKYILIRTIKDQTLVFTQRINYKSMIKEYTDNYNAQTVLITDGINNVKFISKGKSFNIEYNNHSFSIDSDIYKFRVGTYVTYSRSPYWINLLLDFIVLINTPYVNKYRRKRS